MSEWFHVVSTCFNFSKNPVLPGELTPLSLFHGEHWTTCRWWYPGNVETPTPRNLQKFSEFTEAWPLPVHFSQWVTLDESDLRACCACTKCLKSSESSVELSFPRHRASSHQVLRAPKLLPGPKDELGLV